MPDDPDNLPARAGRRMDENPVPRKPDDPGEDINTGEQKPALPGNFASRDEQAWWEEHIIFG